MAALHRALLALVPAVFLSVALVGCERTTSQPAPGVTANPTDLEFVSAAWDVVHFDQEICAEALGRASDPQVKRLAQQILDKANDFDRQLKQIAQEKGIQPPQVLRGDLRLRLVHARLQNGTYFDRIFVADEIATHQEALERAQMMAHETGASPAVQSFLREGRRLLQESLTSLIALQAKVGQPIFAAEDVPGAGGGGGGR